jgi:hypothetical protein
MAACEESFEKEEQADQVYSEPKEVPHPDA